MLMKALLLSKYTESNCAEHVQNELVILGEYPDVIFVNIILDDE